MSGNRQSQDTNTLNEAPRLNYAGTLPKKFCTDEGDIGTIDPQS